MKLFQLESGVIINLDNLEFTSYDQYYSGERRSIHFVSGEWIYMDDSDFERIEELTMFYKGASDE